MEYPHYEQPDDDFDDNGFIAELQNLGLCLDPSEFQKQQVAECLSAIARMVAGYSATVPPPVVYSRVAAVGAASLFGCFREAADRLDLEGATDELIWDCVLNQIHDMAKELT